jgi:hypothetical protein
MKQAVATQLSSPLSSYEFDSGPEGFSLKHRETYPLRLKVFFFPDIYGYAILCDLLQSTKDRLTALEEAEAERRKATLDWEIRSRVAQGVSVI